MGNLGSKNFQKIAGVPKPLMSFIPRIPRCFWSEKHGIFDLLLLLYLKYEIGSEMTYLV